MCICRQGGCRRPRLLAPSGGTHTLAHSIQGPYALTEALLSAQVAQALEAREPTVALKGVKGAELLPPYERTLTRAVQ